MAKSDIGQYGIIPAWILSSNLSSKAVHLFCILACKYADRNGESYPARKTLAHDLGDVSVDTVDRTLHELKTIGAIRVDHQYTDNGDLTSNRYTLHFVPPGNRTDAPTPGPTNAATGDRMDAAGTKPIINQTQREPETPSSDISSSAIATEEISSSGPLKGAKKGTQITPEFRARMSEKYSPVLLDSVDDIIDLALAHKASKKYTDLQAYVNNWLRREAERIVPVSITKTTEEPYIPKNVPTEEELRLISKRFVEEQEVAKRKWKQATTRIMATDQMATKEWQEAMGLCKTQQSS